MKDNLLEIGDVLYTYGNGGYLIRSIVKSVSPKRAKAGYIETHREVTKRTYYNDTDKFVVRVVGSYGDAFLETPQLLKDWEDYCIKVKARQLTQQINTDKLSTIQRQAIIELIESFITKTETA